MNPLTAAVLKTGLVSNEQLAEFKRWRAPVEMPEGASKKPPASIEEASHVLEEALQSEGYILTRETDLEVLQQYLKSQTPGILHVEIVGDALAAESSSNIPITYGVTPLGDYIIPWRSESIQEELANGFTYLDTGSEKVFFQDVRELFFGDHKAFMVCSPRRGS